MIGKKNINDNYQFDSKISSIIIFVSCISVMLLVIYFGVSLTSKGTFTLDDNVVYYCSGGGIASVGSDGKYYCCVNASFPSLGLSTSNCTSPFYGNAEGIDEDGYCTVSDQAFCDTLASTNPEYNVHTVVDDSDQVCKFLCSIPSTLPVSCTINGEEGSINENGICEPVGSPNPVYCTEYGEFIAGIDGNAVILKKNGCDTCPPEWRWDSSNTRCQTTLYSFATDNGYAFYYKNDAQMTCADGYNDVIADGEHICKQEFTCSYGNLAVDADNSSRIVGTLTNNSNAIVCCHGIGWYDTTDDKCTTTIDDDNHRYRAWAGDTKCVNVGDDSYERSGQWCTLGEPINNIPELEEIGEDRCDVVNKVITHITRCEKMRTGTTCNDNENKDKLCYKSDNTTIKRCDLTSEDSPICKKKCKYCSNGVEKVDSSVPNRGQTCSAYHDGYHEYSETVNCSSTSGSVTQKTCYKCTANSTTPLDGQFDACIGEWSETVPNCSKTCKYCSNGEEKTVSNVPKLKDCSAYHDGYHEYNETLNCSGNTNDNNNNTITTNNGSNGNVTDNAQTGSTAIIIAWIIGITAVGYAFYYFRQTSSNS